MPDVETDHVTTDKDPHKFRHKAMLAVLVWFAVYPIVTISTYLLPDLGMPTWLRTFFTTLLTVPIITFVVVPNAKALISRADPKA
jgi:antibiotic biosynthesis monooxygenase (ABM) superfamily enzyme